MSLYLFACALMACDSAAYAGLAIVMLFPALSVPVLSGADAFFPSMFRALRQAPPLQVPEPASCDSGEPFFAPPAADQRAATLARRLLAHWLLVHGLLRLSTACTSSCAAVSVCVFSLGLEVAALAIELLCTEELMLHRTLGVILKSMFLIFVCLVAKMPGCSP